ncbi:MAG: DNA cytosine methyltransferase [Bacteriovoracaceae bacterium]|nr:DNA cytosine methyltransferase [Bacteriovoracaceae bacterium]
MTAPIKIIDLFAGPGGLGEGFSSLRDEQENPIFKIALSIEKEESAHKTLTLRAFYRQFEFNKVPKEYYDFLKGKLGKDPFDTLFQIPKLKKYADKAFEEAKCLTLGEDNKEIHRLIKNALGKNKKNWVLIGGPPCQAYSLAGRSRNKGNASYNAESDHRNFLYLEYLKVIAKFQPAIFVMENVKGMLSAKVNGNKIVDDILKDLKKPSVRIDSDDPDAEYEIFSLSKELDENPKPPDFLIRSEKYGVPQARHRVILLGIRKDYLKKTPKTLTPPDEKFVSVRDVISDLPRLRSGLSKKTDTYDHWAHLINEGANPALSELEKMKLSSVARDMKKSLGRIQGKSLTKGSNWHQPSLNSQNNKLSKWYRDPSNKRLICNHDTRGHIEEDLVRYLFCSSYGRKMKESPKAGSFPLSLTPNHKNWESGKFADRFRVQLADRYATTITSHISKDGHYYIHYDPSQCRSLTVREAARIQTFPDNYFFVGTRTEQYVQVGNAVPPYLAYQIAQIVSELFK